MNKLIGLNFDNKEVTEYDSNNQEILEAAIEESVKGKKDLEDINLSNLY